MQVIQDELMFCSICTQVACNGPNGIDAQYVELRASITGLAKLGPHVVPSFNSETGEGLYEFSHVACDCCDTGLAGYRAEFVVLGE
jgi:hypothetical protein